MLLTMSAQGIIRASYDAPAPAGSTAGWVPGHAGQQRRPSTSSHLMPALCPGVHGFQRWAVLGVGRRLSRLTGSGSAGDFGF